MCWNRIAAVLLLPAALGCTQNAPSSATATAAPASVYVMAGAPQGDGSRARPLATLRQAQAQSAPGDTIYLLPSDSVLDGGIALKPGQKLIGLSGASGAATLTNTTMDNGGAAVVLATANEVSGLAFAGLVNIGILGAGLDASGAVIRNNTFTGSPEAEYDADLPNFAVILQAGAGKVADVRVTGNTISDGAMGGIFVQHTGNAQGSYHFERNRFDNLAGRAYHLWSQDDSVIDAVILNSSADNIGVGGQNSDSILPHVSGRSAMTLRVSGYHYNNTNQEGSPSNCGLEAFVMGPPFPGATLACVGCSLNLTIEDSVFENPVTDGIQIVNFGTNARLDVAIRNTRITGAAPQQIGGGISLYAQNDRNTGSETKLLIEHTEVIDSSGYGFALLDEGEGYTAVVDLGGGALGSAGGNRFVGSGKGELLVNKGVVVARDNEWGQLEPRVQLVGERSRVDVGG